MATSKIFDVSGEGKDLRIRMQGGNIMVARLFPALQGSATQIWTTLVISLIDIELLENSGQYFSGSTNFLHLKVECGDMAYWPNDGGHFNIMHLTNRTSLQVMGERLRGTLSADICKAGIFLPWYWSGSRAIARGQLQSTRRKEQGEQGESNSCRSKQK